MFWCWWVLLPDSGCCGNKAGGGGGGGGSSAIDPKTSQQLELTRAALAATENLEVVEADVSWSKLFSESKTDQSVALNRAINRVLRVDDLSAKATNASLDDSARKNVRRQLPDAISAARQAIEDFGKVSQDDVLAMWLDTRVDLHEAALLPGLVTKLQRKKVYKRVAAAIRGEAGKSSKVRILGGSLIQVVEQLEDPIDGLPGELLADAADAIGQLSDQQPTTFSLPCGLHALISQLTIKKRLCLSDEPIVWQRQSNLRFGVRRNPLG